MSYSFPTFEEFCLKYIFYQESLVTIKKITKLSKEQLLLVRNLDKQYDQDILAEFDALTGKTTIGVAYVLYYVLTHPTCSLGIFFRNKNDNKELYLLFKLMLAKLPKEIREWNMHSKFGKDIVEFENKSIVRFIHLKKHAIRGLNLNLALLDDPAVSVFNLDIYDDFRSSMHNNGKIIILHRRSNVPNIFDRIAKYILIGKINMKFITN